MEEGSFSKRWNHGNKVGAGIVVILVEISGISDIVVLKCCYFAFLGVYCALYH